MGAIKDPICSHPTAGRIKKSGMGSFQTIYGAAAM